ncbi:MAG: methanogenesis marker 3 protein [archaeon]|nr:methanogenesis marker 3 protein [archaeon]
MKVTVNGRTKELKEGATLKQAIAGERYVEGSSVSIHLSTDKVTEVTNDFSIVTTVGEMVLHLYDTPEAKLFRRFVDDIRGSNVRWANKELTAFGSFPTDIAPSKDVGHYRRYEVFFSLGGNDNETTYIMVAKSAFQKSYGAGSGKIGKITVGRHLLGGSKEGGTGAGSHPVVSETSQDNVVITKDLDYPMADGYSVSTGILVKLDVDSPRSAEQILVVASKGYFKVSEGTGTFMGCRDDMDVDISAESCAVRDVGAVTVRSSGVGKGHIMVYKERRQLSPALNSAGTVVRGMALVSRAQEGDIVTVETDPPRILSVGMTQAEGQKFLEKYGVRQIRSGDTSDSAIIVDQGPEATMDALRKGEVETIGVSKDQIYRITIKAEDERTVHYFKKVTGLSHKPIGQLKVQFSFPGSPMVTFFGDEARSQDLYPQEPFKKCKKGEIGVTNQSRHHHGLIGIRLQDSKQYGPTGEEAYGTNIVGTFHGNLADMEILDDEQIIYVTEAKL